MPARLTVDMYRLPESLSPVEVSTKPAREGKRIKVVEAEFFSGGISTARATCQLLRRTEKPRQCLVAPNWDAPQPTTNWAPTDPRSA